MAISKVGTYPPSDLQKPQETAPRPGGEDKTASAKEAAAATPDKVDISKGAQEMAKANKVAMERGDIRTEEVERVRNMVNDQTYVVQPEKIAAKMLDEVF